MVEVDFVVNNDRYTCSDFRELTFVRITNTITQLLWDFVTVYHELTTNKTVKRYWTTSDSQDSQCDSTRRRLLACDTLSF